MQKQFASGAARRSLLAQAVGHPLDQPYVAVLRDDQVVKVDPNIPLDVISQLNKDLRTAIKHGH